jgi:hypothetical protein
MQLHRSRQVQSLEVLQLREMVGFSRYLGLKVSLLDYPTVTRNKFSRMAIFTPKHYVNT